MKDRNQPERPYRVAIGRTKGAEPQGLPVFPLVIVIIVVILMIIVLVPVSLGFAYVPLFPVIKLVIAFPLTVMLCYLLSHFFLEKIHLKKRTRDTQNS